MNVNFNGNNQSTGGGGGGDATAANQVLEIEQLQNIVDSLSILNTEDTQLSVLADLNNIQDSTESANQSLLKLIDAGVIPSYTNLKSLLDVLNAIGSAIAGASGTNDKLGQLLSSVSIGGLTNLKDLLTAITTSNTFLNLINNGVNSLITSTDNNVFGALKGIEGANQLYVRANTNATITIRCDFQTVNNLAQKKYLNLQIEANAGAPGTINIEVRNSSTAPYIVVPLIDKQATFAAAFLNPPFNVAGAKMYQLDVSGYYDVRFTFSIPSASYFVNYSTSVI